MDVYTALARQRFVLDAAKAATNWTKHAISFEEAREAVLDPLALFEDATSADEARQSCIGETMRGSVLFVVHVERSAGVIRIVSARLANHREKSRYENE